MIESNVFKTSWIENNLFEAGKNFNKFRFKRIFQEYSKAIKIFN